MSDEGAAATETFAARWIVAICAVAGLLLGLLLFTLRTPTYEAETIVNVTNPIGTIGDEAALVSSDRILGPASATLGFRPEVEVEPNEPAGLLTITARSDDPVDAAESANRVAQTYLQAQTSAATTIAQSAEVPTNPVSPNRMAHILAGSALGAIFGAMLSWLRIAAPERRRVGNDAGEPTERPAPIRPARPVSKALRPPEAQEAASEPIATDEMIDDEADYEFEPLPTPNTGFANALGPVSASTDDSHDTTPVETDDLDLEFDHSQTPTAAAVIDISNPEGQAREGTFSRVSTSMVAMPPATVDRWNDGPQHLAEPIDSPGSDDGFEPVIDVTAADFEVSAQDDHGSDPTDAVDGPVNGAVDDDADEPGEPDNDIVHDLTDAATAEFDATASSEADVIPASVEAPTAEGDRTIIRLQRQIVAMRAAHREALDELRAEHADAAASLESDYSQQLSGERAGHAATRLELATATARIKRLSGTDQHRIGDLEAQVETLEDEIGQLRSQLEAERIGHVRSLADERAAADRSLDQARRDFRIEVEAIEQQSRNALASNRRDLDDELARDRASLEEVLENEHHAHETAITAERTRHREELERLVGRHRSELAERDTEREEALARQANQTKQTIAELRASEKQLSADLAETRKSEHRHRNELAASQARERAAANEHRQALAGVRSDLASTRKELQAEKERNAALRQDVVRRTAEAHQAIDRAIDERSAQLAELEELMSRQREHAEQRVREANRAADERARAASKREAQLSARITRLERELQQLRERSA